MCALHVLIICVILNTMWLGNSLQLLCILPFGMLCLSAISMILNNVFFVVSSIHTLVNLLYKKHYLYHDTQTQLLNNILCSYNI